MSYSKEQMSKAIAQGAKQRQKKVEEVKVLTPEEKVELIKKAFKLSHGGSKKNKKKKKKRR